MPYLNHDGHRLCFETFGQPDGTPILINMGIGGQILSWPQNLFPLLADLGFFVIAHDYRDAGLSTATSEASDYDLNDMVGDLTALMDHLGVERTVMLGASFGGILTQYFALMQPERLIGTVLFMTTSGEPSLPPGQERVMGPLFADVELNTDEERIRHDAYLRGLLSAFTPWSDSEDEVLALARAGVSRAYRPHAIGLHFAALKPFEGAHEKLAALKKIRTLIIHGTNDPVFAVDHARDLVSRTGGTLKLIPQLGHELSTKFAPVMAYLIADYFLPHQVD